MKKSWIPVAEESNFPIQNIPFGIFSTPNKTARPGVAIGDQILDLLVLWENGFLTDFPFQKRDIDHCVLNDMMRHGKSVMSKLRLHIIELLSEGNVTLAQHPCVNDALVNQVDATMHLPVHIGDYTDFYSSEDHARNVGMMFRDPAKALLPNWKHLPVGYHGRSSTIVPSGTPIKRPQGQTNASDDTLPVFQASQQLDFELEMAFVTFNGKAMGESISTAEAKDYIFGFVIFNDWSARDIQRWEYVPLGPFLAKNFASTISPWIVTLDALEEFHIDGPIQDPEVLPYLKYQGPHNVDIHLTVSITPDGGKDTVVSQSNYKYMYWNYAQQLAHHTVGGCAIRVGDMMASGTISGPEKG
ncbi:MAG: fumarylacetoacetase, partial [Bacteroidetes bacterium]|nr:fumarylacetoacetase [Bacteroidota bacterium]